jgi:hypothetical protein
MDRLAKMSPAAYVEAMREEFERVMKQVAEAVNAAPEGHVISGSEEEVRDLLGAFRAKAYETAVQMRVHATEAAFFPGGPADGEADAQQGGSGARAADGQRAHPS